MATQPKKTQTAIAAEINGTQLSLTFASGDSLVIDSTKLAPAIIAQAIMHGLKQKLIDAAAISRDPETGRTATIDDKYRAVRAVYDRITHPDAPEWNKTRAGEGGGNKGGLLLRAMMRLTGKSREDVMAFLEDKSKEEIAALRKNPRVTEIMDQLRAESAKTDGIDSDALLDGLMGDAE